VSEGPRELAVVVLPHGGPWLWAADVEPMPATVNGGLGELGIVAVCVQGLQCHVTVSSSCPNLSSPVLVLSQSKLTSFPAITMMHLRTKTDRSKKSNLYA